MRILQAGTADIEFVSFSPSGNGLLIAGCDRRLFFAKLDSSEHVNLIANRFTDSKPAFVLNATAVAIKNGPELRIISLANQSSIQEITEWETAQYISTPDGMRIIGWSPDSRSLRSLFADEFGRFQTSWEVILRPEPLPPEVERDPAALAKQNLLSRIRAARRLAHIQFPYKGLTAYNNRTFHELQCLDRITIRNVDDGREIRCRNYPFSNVHKLKLLPALGGELLFAVEDRQVAVLNADDWSRPPNVGDIAPGWTDIAAHPSGRWLAACHSAGRVKIYDASTLTLAKSFAWSIRNLRTIDISPDGLLAAAGGEAGQVVLWDFDE